MKMPQFEKFPAVGAAYISSPLALSVGGRGNAPQRLPPTRRVRGRPPFPSSHRSVGFKTRGSFPASIGDPIGHIWTGESVGKGEKVVGVREERGGRDRVACGVPEKVPVPVPFSVGEGEGGFLG